MPYADPDMQRAAGAKSYRERRAADPAFAASENERVKEWKDGNEEYLARERQKRMERYYANKAKKKTPAKKNKASPLQAREG